MAAVAAVAVVDTAAAAVVVAAAAVVADTAAVAAAVGVAAVVVGVAAVVAADVSAGSPAVERRASSRGYDCRVQREPAPKAGFLFIEA